MKYKTKKSQIGSTLTWVVAFLLISFIMVIFLASVVVSSGKKNYFSQNSNIETNDYNSKLKSQNELINLLNSRIIFFNKEDKIKNILIDVDYYSLNDQEKNELRAKIKKNADNLLKQSSKNPICYIFQAYYGNEDPDESMSKFSGMRGANFFSDDLEKRKIQFSSVSENPYYNDPRIGGVSKTQGDNWLKIATLIYLIQETKTNSLGALENQKIRIKFYSGECLG
ncbi:MAG: hypothetical protein Q8N99_04120 [Nanoarchaeota archaeon]|nr:hypothetical protein [Nanoarchaeota archaeon]